MTESENPWVSRPVEQPELTTEQESVLAAPTGPVSPQRGVPTPESAQQLPTVQRAQAADLWWLGAHGGAGETTLAELDERWVAADHTWPGLIGQQAPARVVLTARSSFGGLHAAQAAATQWAAGLVPQVEVLGLVIIADAPGRLPRPLRELIQVIGGGVPRVWRLPWIESWRIGDPVTLADAPRSVRKLVDDLGSILRSSTEPNSMEPQGDPMPPTMAGADAPSPERN